MKFRDLNNTNLEKAFGIVPAKAEKPQLIITQAPMSVGVKAKGPARSITQADFDVMRELALSCNVTYNNKEKY